MGCDIHSTAEFKNSEGKWIENEEKIFPDYGEKTTEPFGWRSYGMFAFLADVRNYNKIKCIRRPRGLPKNSESLNKPSKYYKDGTTERQSLLDDGNYHTFGYLTLQELIEFDYEQIIEDRRTSARTGPNSFTGAADAGEGNGRFESIREFLGESFFEQIEVLKTLGKPEDVRIVFYFDN